MPSSKNKKKLKKKKNPYILQSEYKIAPSTTSLTMDHAQVRMVFKNKAEVDRYYDGKIGAIKAELVGHPRHGERLPPPPAPAPATKQFTAFLHACCGGGALGDAVAGDTKENTVYNNNGRGGGGNHGQSSDDPSQQQRVDVVSLPTATHEHEGDKGPSKTRGRGTATTTAFAPAAKTTTSAPRNPPPPSTTATTQGGPSNKRGLGTAAAAAATDDGQDVPAVTLTTTSAQPKKKPRRPPAATAAGLTFVPVPAGGIHVTHTAAAMMCVEDAVTMGTHQYLTAEQRTAMHSRLLLQRANYEMAKQVLNEKLEKGEYKYVFYFSLSSRA